MSQRTWWHLEGRGRAPTEYEVVSTRLLWHGASGFEVATPAGAWLERHQRASPLRCSDWERFSDPERTTYARYTATRRDRETMVEQLLDALDGTAYDASLSPAWRAVLDRVMAPARYPLHAMQMLAAYVGHLAPSGRITLAALFQSGDAMRAVHRLAYRLAQLRQTWPELGATARATWEDDPLWQPLRETIERLLVTWDWGESLVASNLVVKPCFDALLFEHLAALARCCGDDVLGHVLRSLGDDARWHRAWSVALVRMALDDQPEGLAAVRGWIDRWTPLAERAVEAFRPVFEEMPETSRRTGFDAVRAAIAAERAETVAAATGAR